jgi:hypothetical protein
MALNNLYWIIDKSGNKFPLQIELGSRKLYDDMQALCLEECRRIIFFRDFDEVFTLVEDLAIRIGDKQPTFQKEINAALARNQAPYILYRSSEKGWMIIETGTEVERETVLQCLSDLRDLAFEKSLGAF